MTPDQAISDIRDVMRRPNFIARDATFSELRSTGNLQLLRNRPLKNALFEYYKDYGMITKVENAEREVANSVTVTYLMHHLSLKALTRNEVKPAQAAEVTRLLGETEFGNHVTVRLLNRRELLGNYQEMRALGKEITVSLRKQLAE